MTINDSITNIQQARAIIKEVGELYQYVVSDKLRGLTYYPSSDEYGKKAQKVISNIENEYVLNTANVLWKDKFEEIPQWLKEYGE